MAQSIYSTYLTESQDTARVYWQEQNPNFHCGERMISELSECYREIKYLLANSHRELKPQSFTQQPYQSLALVSFHAFTYSGQQTMDLLVAVTVDYLLVTEKEVMLFRMCGTAAHPRQHS